MTTLEWIFLVGLLIAFYVIVCLSEAALCFLFAVPTIFMGGEPPKLSFWNFLKMLDRVWLP